MAITVDSYLAALRLKESGGSYTAKNPTSTASGAYGYLDSTWNHFGGYAHASQAPKAVQDARAKADVTARLKAYGGDWQKVAAAHFAGSGWVAAHPDVTTWNVNPAPGSTNPTVRDYVTDVLKGATTSSGGVTAGTSAGGSTTYTGAQLFQSRLKAFLAAAPPGLGIASGTRTHAEQQKLYDAWVAGGKTGPVVAEPGTSKHETGQAVDLSFANPTAKTWAHDNAAAYGLTFPVKGEDWHIEASSTGNPVGSTSRTDASGAVIGVGTGNPDVRPNDWIGTLDALLNPTVESHLMGLVPDVGQAIQLVAARTGIALLGIVLFGAGLALAVGPEVLIGAAARRIPGATEVAGTVEAAAVTHSRRATGNHGEHEDIETKAAA